MPKHKSKPPPEVCPVCGAEVPPRALACPECGSDDETGWKDEAAIYDGLDLPDTEFDYDECVKKEFGGKASSGDNGKRWRWFVVAVVTLTAFGAMILGITR